MISRRTLITGVMAVPLASSPISAIAQSRLRIAHTSSSDWTPIFLARESGIFAKHNIDADFVLVPVSPAVPAAIQSGSVQIGGATPPSFLQAVDNGLDLVAVAGGTISAGGIETALYVVRTGSDIDKPASFKGKKIGTPGLGSVLDVLFREWLIQNGVEPNDVTWVEAAFPTHADVLRAGAVDAIITAEPVLTRVKAQGLGTAFSFISKIVPVGCSMTLYITSRRFAENNRAAVRAFVTSLNEGATAAASDLERARQAFATYIKLPPEVLQTMTFSRQQPALKADQLDWWQDLLIKQKLIARKRDSQNLIFDAKAG